jgi:hypothetical protein
VLPDFRKKFPQASAFFPFGKRNFFKTSVEHWWRDTDMRSEMNPSQCHFFTTNFTWGDLRE